MTPELLPCPWCGNTPDYKTLMHCQSWNDCGITRGAHTDREAEVIECVNTKCPVRPKLTRVQSDDAVQIWNTRVPPAPAPSDVVPIGDLETAAKDFARMWRETQERERELREALAWAVKRIERFAPHRASEGDGELYALANAKALAKARDVGEE
jgi:hypothetical protein